MNIASSPDSWLITGGAGYIGAHIVHAMKSAGRPVVVYDDLSTGVEARAQGAPFVKGSVLDTDLLERTLREHKIAGVLHIAAKKQVGESMEQPVYYYRENVGGLASVLEAMDRAGVRRLVYSSSAAVYGTPDQMQVTEEAQLHPESPYGETKTVGEWMLRDMARAGRLDCVALRYFNVAGAASPELGDPGIFNLVPLVLAAMSRGDQPKVYGSDYDTPDGTCIRDYVHVADIAGAHLAAIGALESRTGFSVYNVGRGQGSSVLDVIAALERASGHKFSPEIIARRPGDPSGYVGDVTKINSELGWQAKYDLEQIASSAWSAWQNSHPA